MKFKIGDRVRDSGYNGGRLYTKECVGTVEDIRPKAIYPYYVKLDNSDGIPFPYTADELEPADDE